MRLRGAIDVRVPAARAWSLLDDAERLAAAVPGFESAERSGVITASVGPVAGRFRFTSRVVERRPGESMTVTVEGEEALTRSRLSGRVVLSVAATDAAATRLAYVADVAPEGRLAVLGDMVLRATAGLFLRELGDRLRLEALGADPDAPGDGSTADRRPGGAP